MAVAQVGKTRSPETRAKIALACKGNKHALGHHHTPETKERIRKSNLGKHISLLGIPKSESHRQNISAGLRGNKNNLGNSLSEETKAKISAALKGKPHPWARGNTHNLEWISSWPKSPTKLEKGLYELLSSAGYDFERQARFNRYVVDAYVPSHNVAFEADGNYWHQDKSREIQRDSYLIAKGLYAVVHLTEEDLESWLRESR